MCARRCFCWLARLLPRRPQPSTAYRTPKTVKGHSDIIYMSTEEHGVFCGPVVLQLGVFSPDCLFKSTRAIHVAVARTKWPETSSNDGIAWYMFSVRALMLHRRVRVAGNVLCNALVHNCAGRQTRDKVHCNLVHALMFKHMHNMSVLGALYVSSRSNWHGLSPKSAFTSGRAAPIAKPRIRAL